MKNLDRILVPVDFSECSKNALDFALRVVDILGGKITVLHAYHIPFVFPEAGNAISPEQIENIEEDVEVEFEKIRSDLKNQISKIDGFVKIASFGLDAIYKQLATNQYDIIIMGTKGVSGLAETFIGSVTSNVIEHVNVPVMCIPEKAKYAGIKNIAFACDYEEMDSPRELDILKLFALKYDACVNLVNIKEKSKAGHFEEAMYFESFFNSVRHTHNTSRFQNFEAGINDFIESNEIDLLAVMPRKKNIIEKFFGPSHTRKLAYHTKIPLLAFHE